MKDFSFVMPTRGWSKGLKKFIDQLEITTHDLGRIEVLLAVDEGDTSVYDGIKHGLYHFPIFVYERPKTDNFSEDYYNFLARKSNGKNIWVFNDDAWIKTMHWDDKVLKRIKNSNLTGYLVDTNDSTKTRPLGDFCRFPLISRVGVGITSYLLHPKIRIYPADKIAFDIYATARCVVNATDVEIQHDHIHESDSSKARMMKIFEEDMKNGPLDINKEVIGLLRQAKTDLSNKPSKLSRIIEIIKEK